MILMHPDYLLFRVGSGETIPCSAEVATVELLGDACSLCDPDVIRGAASAVLHYFKNELGQDCVSVGEFAQALARVLRGFGLKVQLADEDQAIDSIADKGVTETATAPPPRVVVESDLRELACACGKGFELAFFPRLRGVLRLGLKDAPSMVRFVGLRGCVKLLLGAQRWSPRCQELNDRIVEYLRGCLSEEAFPPGCSLLVE